MNNAVLSSRQSTLYTKVVAAWENGDVDERHTDYPHFVTTGRNYGRFPRLAFVGHEAAINGRLLRGYHDVLGKPRSEAVTILRQYWSKHLNVDRPNYYTDPDSTLRWSPWWDEVYAITKGTFSSKWDRQQFDVAKGRTWDAGAVLELISWANLFPVSHLGAKSSTIRNLNIDLGFTKLACQQLHAIEPDVTVFTVNPRYDEELQKLYDISYERREGIAVDKKHGLVITDHLQDNGNREGTTRKKRTQTVIQAVKRMLSHKGVDLEDYVMG